VTEDSEQLSIKIPKGLIRFMDIDIAENKDLRNRSEYIIAAIRAYEEYRVKFLAEKKMAEKKQ
jgi:metal-responsive CopG/Arc/MetJ family transcriptional regulator